MLLIGTLVAFFCFVTHWQESNAAADVPADRMSELRTIIHRKLAASTEANLDSATVTAVHRAEEEWFTNLSIPEDHETAFLVSNLNAELTNFQEEELLIRFLLGRVCRRDCDVKEYAGCARFLNRLQASTDVDSTIIASLVLTEIRQTNVFSDAEWERTLEKYLSPKDDAKTVLSSQILVEAENNHWKFSEGDVLPVWTDDEKKEMAAAIIRTQKQILARRYIHGHP